MQKIHTDIVVSGGGVAGLTCAAAFGSAGFNVICVDPTPPVTTQSDTGSDLRTTAFFQSSRRVLEDAGIWQRLDAVAAPLQVMRIVDAGGETPEPRVVKDFDASEISDLPFGWNLPNWLLRREMVARLAELPTVDFRTGVGFDRMVAREAEALVTLTDGTHIRAKLVIGADGRNSAVRKAVGIDAHTTRYGQKAVVFAVTHDAPHDSISTEVHRSGGPFTLVPLPDQDGRACSSVVWMEKGAEVERLMALDDDAFSAEATQRSAGILGDLKLLGRRQAWPIITQKADALTYARTALVAEAAHVVPPIGAQGLNMSLGDIYCLLQLAKDAPDSLGDAKMLATYARRRTPEIAMRVRGIDALNRTSMAGAPALRDLRAKGLDALYSARPIRKALMELGLGGRL